MMNESFTSRRQLTIAGVVLLAALAMLLIPGVPAQVASVPETIRQCAVTTWSWLGDTIAWIF